MYVVINATDAVNADLQHAIVISCNNPYKSCHLQLCIQKLTIAGVHKIFQLQLYKEKLSIVIVQTKVINCSSVNKSYQLQ